MYHVRLIYVYYDYHYCLMLLMMISKRMLVFEQPMLVDHRQFQENVVDDFEVVVEVEALMLNVDDSNVYYYSRKV